MLLASQSKYMILFGFPQNTLLLTPTTVKAKNPEIGVNLDAPGAERFTRWTAENNLDFCIAFISIYVKV